MGERLIQEAVEHFRAARVPEYRFPERAASALAVLTRRAEFLARPEIEAPTLPGLHPQRVRGLLNGCVSSAHPQAVLDGSTVYPMLEAYGIPGQPSALAHSAEQAAQIAQKIGFPVAVKVASPDIPHKSDVGGVLLDLPDPQAVADGFMAVTRNARRASPAARIDGATVQRMLPGGQEVIIGAVQDAQFGPLVMFGSGGVEVEGLKDVAFALAPLTLSEADGLLEHTWAGRKLRGYRSLPPADREAVLQTVLRLGQLAADFPELAEIEINPLRVLEAGQGAFALDVRARLQLQSD